MNHFKKIILLIDLSESYGRNFIKGINRYSDIFGPWSFCKMPPFYREKYGIDGILEFAKSWEADGIIGQFYNTAEINKLIDENIYPIAVDFREKFDQVSNISGDYLQAGKMAAEYFLAKGYKNFAYYGFHETVWSRERERGFTQTLRRQGFQTSVYAPQPVSSHNFWYYAPSPLQEWLNSLKKPVAIFTCDDSRSEHLAEAARLSNIHIPQEVALLGIDNDEIICNFSSPPLSSIQQDEENAGYQAAQLLDKMITHQQNVKEDILVKPLRIITRQSTDMLALEDPFVRKALIFIQENLDKLIHVDDVTNVVPLSRRALEKRFRKATGRSVYQEIQRQRIQKVVKLLLDSNLTITDIAILCGYEDNKNLSRIFTGIHGVTPLQYRKKYRFQH